MAIILYREGNTHTNRGVKCESGRFPHNRLKDLLKVGWVTDPRTLYIDQDVPKETDPNELNNTEDALKKFYEYDPDIPCNNYGEADVSEEKESEAENKTTVQNTDETSQTKSPKEVRLVAKLAGIKNYKTARIATLKEKLGYEQ